LAQGDERAGAPDLRRVPEETGLRPGRRGTDGQRDPGLVDAHARQPCLQCPRPGPQRVGSGGPPESLPGRRAPAWPERLTADSKIRAPCAQIKVTLVLNGRMTKLVRQSCTLGCLSRASMTKRV